MKRPYLTVSLLIGALALAGISHRAWKAHLNLVTLDVRDMDVRKVVSKIEWQTWEMILVQKDLQGKITLKVNDMPLAEVLGIIADQTSSRWSAYYPLYSSSKSLKNFKKVLRGELDPAEGGWAALQPRGFRGGRGGGPGGFGGGGPGFGGGGGFFGGAARNDARLVTLQLANKDLEFTTLALARFAQAKVVPEDGTSGNLNVSLTRVPMPKAVAAVAKQVHRNWTEYYALQSWRGFRPTNEWARTDDSTNGPPFGEDRPWGRRRDGTNDMRANMERQNEIDMATMTPEELKQAEERRKQFEEMRDLSPEERRARFEQMRNSPGFQQGRDNRMNNSIKNLTPEQRNDRYKQIAERRLRGQQNGRGGR